LGGVSKTNDKNDLKPGTNKVNENETFDLYSSTKFSENNKDNTLALSGNGCLGFYDENIGDCDIVKASTGEVLLKLRSCTEDRKLCATAFTLGKTDFPNQYILESFGDSCVGSMSISAYDSEKNQLNEIGNFSSTRCSQPGEPDYEQEQRNIKAFNEALQKYALPNP
jgi:hypothetical protein